MNYRFIFKIGRKLETLKYTRTIHADNMISILWALNTHLQSDVLE